MSCCGHSHSVDPSSGTTSDVNIVEVGGTPVSSPLPVDTELPAAVSLADNTANPTVPGVGSFVLVWDGSTWDRAPGNSTDGQLVNLGSNNDVTVTSGTVTANQGTSPWVVSGTVTATPTGTQDVNLLQVGSASFAQGQRAVGSSLSVVLATSHAAVTVTGTVAATQSGTWILGANSGVDIGDVTINNAAGASSVNIQDGGNTITVDGTVSVGNFPPTQTVAISQTGSNNDVDVLTLPSVTQGTSPWVVSGTVTATEAHTKVEDTAHVTGDTGSFILAVRNDSAASLTTTNGDYSPIAVDTAGKVGITDLGGSLTVDAFSASAALADNATNSPFYGVDQSGNRITNISYSFLYDGATWDRAPGNSADGALVNLGSNNDVTVTSGTVSATQGTSPWVVSLTSTTITGTVAVTQSGAWPVTANAGTNLNTSALNLEATQADVRTALQIIDDWDESDRAKVNPIVGQAGVQGGSGAVSALTQRVTLATDVALPTGTNSIGKVIQEANAAGEGLLVLRDPALSNTAVAVKASSGRLYGYHIFNPGTALAYVQIYNVAAASVVVGTTTPIITLAMPSNSSSSVGVDHLFSTPVTFGTAIAVAATTTPTGGSAPATAIVTNFFYK